MENRLAPHKDNKLTPESFRAALQEIRAMRDSPIPHSDHLYLSDDWVLDWVGLHKDDSVLFDSLMQSTSENAGKCIMPIEVYDDLVSRGYLVRRSTLEALDGNADNANTSSRC